MLSRVTMPGMKLHALAFALLLPALSPAAQSNGFGNPQAPVRIDVFSDFQCSHCKTFHDEVLPQLMKDYVDRGKVYLVYRNFPLPSHQYARKAAELVSACGQVGKYEPAAKVL